MYLKHYTKQKKCVKIINVVFQFDHSRDTTGEIDSL